MNLLVRRSVFKYQSLKLDKVELRTLQQKSSFARVFGVFFQKSQSQEKLQ